MTTTMVMVNDDDDNSDGDKTVLKQDDWISAKYFQYRSFFIKEIIIC